MTIRVQLFAAPRQILGRDEIRLDLPAGATVAEVRQSLVALDEGLRPLAAHLRFAVDGHYAHDATPVAPESEVACIPPVSGG